MSSAVGHRPSPGIGANTSRSSAAAPESRVIDTAA